MQPWPFLYNYGKAWILLNIERTQMWSSFESQTSNRHWTCSSFGNRVEHLFLGFEHPTSNIVRPITNKFNDHNSLTKPQNGFIMEMLQDYLQKHWQIIFLTLQTFSEIDWSRTLSNSQTILNMMLNWLRNGFIWSKFKSCQKIFHSNTFLLG